MIPDSVIRPSFELEIDDIIEWTEDHTDERVYGIKKVRGKLSAMTFSGENKRTRPFEKIEAMFRSGEAKIWTHYGHEVRFAGISRGGTA